MKSISASGHKFGLAPLGVGWVVWRDATELPEDLIFHVGYLGGDMPVFQINFSRSAGPVVAQYYDFVRLGREGYRRVREGEDPGYTLFDLADRVRMRGWQVPAYTLTGTASDIAVQRVLIRQGVSRDMAATLLDDLRDAIGHLHAHPVTVPMTKEESSGFNHL